MPIDVPTELLTASSGSVGDVVFSRNQHGPYTRARTAPFDPGSALQLAVRAALSQCVTAWRNTLTAPVRRSWDVYALAVRTATALGRSTHAGGLGMYVRANVPRIQAAEASLPRVDQAPSLFNRPPFTPITRVVLNIVDDTIHPFFADADSWVTEDGAAMLFYVSPPQPLTRNFWAGPYRYAGPLLGSDPRLSSPATIAIPFPAGAAERVFVRGRLTSSDARLSHAFRLPADIVPQVAPLPILATQTGGGATIAITFDALIRDQLHSRLPWTWRFNNARHTCRSATSRPSGLRLSAAPGTSLDPGPDVLDYAPPPSDVHGLLTGLQVAPFANFPIT